MPKVDPFPKPFKTTDGAFGRNFFPYADVVHWIDRRAGRPPSELSAADRVRSIGGAEVRHLLGGVSEMFLWRLIHRAEPKKPPAPGKSQAAPNKKQRKGAA
jgi:hypothetical protein